MYHHHITVLFEIETLVVEQKLESPTRQRAIIIEQIR